MRYYPIDKTLNKIFNETEEYFKDEDVSRDQIVEIFYYLWYNIKELMKLNLYPNILVPKWGSFKPGTYSLKKLSTKLKLDGEIDDHNNIEKIINRLNNEKTKRKRNGN